MMAVKKSPGSAMPYEMRLTRTPAVPSAGEAMYGLAYMYKTTPTTM